MKNEFNTFESGFAKSYDLDPGKIRVAIEEFDKSIDHMKKNNSSIWADLNLGLVYNKNRDEMIKELIRRNPIKAAQC